MSGFNMLPEIDVLGRGNPWNATKDGFLQLLKTHLADPNVRWPCQGLLALWHGAGNPLPSTGTEHP